MLRVCVMVCAMALAGCQTSGEGGAPAAAASSAPAEYRTMAADHIRKTFFDPYSIRDAAIARPKRATGPSLNSDGFNTPWVVCVRANAKNRFGAYAGTKVTAIAMSESGVVNTWDEAHHSRMVCGDVTYEPFPEIDGAAQPASRR